MHSVDAVQAASEEFDFVIIGAGTAGSVLTHRLAEDGFYRNSSMRLSEASRSDAYHQKASE